MTLSIEQVLAGYSRGLFPMADSRYGPISWYRPEFRGIVPLENTHVPHTLLKTIRSGKFIITYDACFETVVSLCAERDETWISPEIEATYNELHRLGFAHSIEAWSAGELSGGLYGVSLGGAFFGESMFHKVRDASKVAFVYLRAHLANRKFTLLDTQYTTPHLASLGGIEVTRAEYEQSLAVAIEQDCDFRIDGNSNGELHIEF